MDMDNIAIQLQKTEDRSLRNEGRIKKLEEAHEVLHQLATAVAVMAEKMDAMNKSVSTLATKVDEIENEPAKRWDTLVTALLSAAAGALVAWLSTGAAV